MTDSLPLANRTVVVTGGFGELGLAVAEAALAASARLVLIGRGAKPAALDPAILTLPDTDLAAFGTAQRAFEKIGQEFGTVDALFNVAGAFEWCSVADSFRDL